MHRTDGTNHLLNLFASANPAAGRPTGTLVTAEWLNDYQENICRFIESRGIALSKNDYEQLTNALSDLVNSAINGVVAGAPSNLNTLNEIAASIGDDNNFIGTMNSALGGKSNNGHGHAQSDVSGLVSALAGKSDDGHGHAQSSITGLGAALASKSDDGHGHATGSISDLLTGFVINVGADEGYIRFPDWLGGIMIQFGITALSGSIGNTQHSHNFPTIFPTACWSVVVATKIEPSTLDQFGPQNGAGLFTKTDSSFVWFSDWFTTSDPDPIAATYIAIGN